MTNKIKEQHNSQFSITHNKEEDCFDILFKKLTYTSAELHSIADYIYSMGKNCEDKVRFAHVEEEKNPSIILN